MQHHSVGVRHFGALLALFVAVALLVAGGASAVHATPEFELEGNIATVRHALQVRGGGCIQFAHRFGDLGQGSLAEPSRWQPAPSPLGGCQPLQVQAGQ